MKVKLIKQNGTAWWWDNMKEARKYIIKSKLDNFEIKEIDGEKIRVYDDRDSEIMEYEKLGSSYYVYNARYEEEAWDFLGTNGVDLSKVEFVEYEEYLKRHIFHNIA